MAWIESHQELRQHPKTKRLARNLGVTIPAAIGHLHLLWWWAVDYAPDGDLTKYEDWEIADAICFETDEPSKVRKALVDSGFLDESEDGLSIHKWSEYAGRTIEQRKNARDRQKKHRDQKNQDVVTGKNETCQSQECNAPVTETSQECNTPVTPLHNITEHNITEHSNTEQDTTGTPPLPPSQGDEGGKPPEKPSKPKPTLSGVQEQRFNEFWEIYPEKQGKGDARKSWTKIKPDEKLFEKIMSAVRESLDRNERWARGYIPNPSTWLNQSRWEDSLPIARSPNNAPHTARGPTGTDAVKDYLLGVMKGGQNDGH